MVRQGEEEGWYIAKYNAVTWKKITDTFLPLDFPRDQPGDMMVALVNGSLDISAEYLPSGTPTWVDIGSATYHEFFTPDLQFIEKKILSDTPHICGTAMIFVDGIYYFIAPTAVRGDVIVMKYDQNWKYLGMKELIKQGNWSEGVAFDGNHFFVSYQDISQRLNASLRPNIHLAVFDLNWNLLENVAVTNYRPEENMFGGRPYVLLYGNRLYVSYDLSPINPKTDMDDPGRLQAYVSVYELTPDH